MATESTTALVGRRLKMARKTMGYCQEKVAKMFKIGRPRYSEIETGKRHLSVEELYKFADFYNRPLGYFFKQNEPTTDPFAVLFRVVENEPETQRAVAEFESLCNNLRFLFEMMGETTSPLFQETKYAWQKYSVGLASALAANSERNTLELGKNPVKNLREILEEKKGIYVFCLGLPDSISGMFAFFEDMGGCILVNNTQTLGRQLFSLAHEYAHFLFHRDEIGCVTKKSNENTMRERLANRFAAEFLMPRNTLEEAFKIRVRDRQATAADVIRLADYFGVSFEAMTYRLSNLRLLKPALRDYLLKETWVRTVRKAMGQPELESRQSRLPSKYLDLCLTAYLQGSISTAKFASLLEIPLYQALEIEQEIKRIQSE